MTGRDARRWRPGSRRAFASAAALALLAASNAAATPRLPCTAGVAVSPAYGTIGGPPAVATWRDLELTPDTACPQALRGEMKLAVALAGRFRHAGGLEDLAARFGAISATEGALYWSTSDREWRSLVSEAYALAGPDPRSRRPDFSAAEILGGRRLHFAQDDTRSTGLNVYSLVARRLGPARLALEIVNRSPIAFTFVTLYDPGDLVSVQFVERLGPEDWGYYAVSAVRGGPARGRERSFINRAAALFRFHAGLPLDREPPLAP